VGYKGAATFHGAPGIPAWTTDDIEKKFFGAADAYGKKAVEFFADYSTDTDGAYRFFRAFSGYMDAQRFRTPRGLDQLKALTSAPDHNVTLMAMQQLFQLHTTMWAEGVWEIARARHSPTKFIVTDEPVTFFNRRIFPSECAYPGAIELDRVGTRTLFPLGLDSCLIITHTQLVRNPWNDPNAVRANARSYDQTMVDLTKIQFGRELEEDEVLRINFILKSRSTRYIAAAEVEWLYPERRASTTNWSKLDDDWFLFPHLYKVPFSREMMMGFRNGTSWGQDEYGRRPNNPKYMDKKLHRQEWGRHLRAQEEWAKRRVGRSLGHVHPFGRDDVVADQLMQKYLEQGGLWPGDSQKEVPADSTT
jgi:hypothetical protein